VFNLPVYQVQYTFIRHIDIAPLSAEANAPIPPKTPRAGLVIFSPALVEVGQLESIQKDAES